MTRADANTGTNYVELCVASNFSFLRGASHAEELVVRASRLGLKGISITDRNSIAGLVRGHMAAKEAGLGFAPGARLCFMDGTPDILAWPMDRAGYGNLCELLTLGKRRAPKGECHINLQDLLDHHENLIIAVLGDGLIQSLHTSATETAERTLANPDMGASSGVASVSGESAICGLDPRVKPEDDVEYEEEDVELKTDAISALPDNGALNSTVGSLHSTSTCEFGSPPSVSCADIPPARGENGARSWLLHRLKARFGDRLYIALARRYGPTDARDMADIAALAYRHGITLIAIGDILYHTPERRPLQDVITCIREHKTLREAGRLLEPNGERHLRSPEEALRLFKGYEAAVSESVRLFDRLDFSLDELRYQYPTDPVFEELGNRPVPSQEALEKLTAIGEKRRYRDGTPQKVREAIAHELALIRKLDYAPYFLTVYDIVRFARSQQILCQGRGSAANSAVCYCLGITEVAPDKVDLLFERFISEERNEPPDIDVDFEHERREEVIQYIYEKYGRDKAGIAATVVTYRSRSAIREVAKVFGYSDDAITAISGTKWGSHSREVSAEDAKRAGLDTRDKHLLQMLDLASQIIGFPRHLSQHVGGFVITRDRLSSVIPIENAAMEDRTIVEWDKDDLESLGMLKIDVLALGMLTCIRKAFTLLRAHYGREETLSSLPDDEDVYDMICRADTIGVFQIESRAQMSMLPRLRPRNYYDLVIEVAIVRPGPIQGDMVHPYLRRRQGKEPVSFPKEELRNVLGKTLGVPLFQEQAMNIAIVAANFSPGEADKLRRAMATFRRVGTIHSFHMKMVEGMVANGYEREFADHCFKQIEGFGEYGFPESHAASFALLVYVSCWLKCHYPDVFCAAILNSQPMGFYAPAQLVRDAREHGVEMREADINCSLWHSTLEHSALPDERKVTSPIAAKHQAMAGIMKNTHAVRLGLHQIKGFGEADAEKLIANRGNGYKSVRDLWLRSGLTRRAIEHLANGDAFRSLGLDRRAAFWEVRALDPLGAAENLPLFAATSRQGGHDLMAHEQKVTLPQMPLGEHVINDYRSLSFSLKAHPVSFVRQILHESRYNMTADLETIASGRHVQVAGLVLVRQRPGSAKGVVFETIEDESGIANIIIWPKVMERYRSIVLGSRFIGVNGKVQSQDGVIHVVANKLIDLTPLLASISEAANEMGGLANADEVIHPQEDIRQKVKPASRLSRLLKEAPDLRKDYLKLAKPTNKALPKGRNFH